MVRHTGTNIDQVTHTGIIMLTGKGKSDNCELEPLFFPGNGSIGISKYFFSFISFIFASGSQKK